MKTYKYHATDIGGKHVHGTIAAIDEYDAVNKIRSSYPVIIDLKETKGEGSGGILAMELGSQKIKEKDLSILCSQFAIMLRSGFPVARCVEMIARQTKDKKLKKTLESVAEDVEQGSTLATALERGSSKFPMTFTETIRAGEQSGTLEESFVRMQSYYEKSYKNAAKVKQAMIYPIFVIIIAIVVLLVVMLKVIPVLAQTFDSLGGDLPLMTQILIGMSNFFAKYWLIMLIVIVAVVLLIKVYQRTEQGAIAWSKFMLRMPVFGKVNLFNNSAQFADTMEILISSGFSVNRSLEVTAKVLPNYAIATETQAMVEKVEEGRMLGACMKETDIFPDNLIEMCTIGEESGELEDTLNTIADYYHNEADNATATILSMLEPVMLIFLAIFAGFIVISIYLPMFTMYNYM